MDAINNRQDSRVQPESIRKRAVKSVKWTLFAELVGSASQPLVTIGLANALSPSDFGIVAASTIVVGLAQILQDLGLNKALIQDDTDRGKAPGVALVMNLAFSTTLYLMLYSFASPLAGFFHEPLLTSVIRIQALQVPLLSVASVYQALLVKAFMFRRMFAIRLTSSLVFCVAAVLLTYHGFGFMGLVWASVVGRVSQLGLCLMMTPWRPRFTFESGVAARLLGFGSWVSAEALLLWVLGYADSLAIGHFLGTHWLGVYRVGNQVITLMFSVTTNPLVPVFYAVFCRMRDDRDRLLDCYSKSVRLVTLITIPAGFGTLVLAQPVSRLVFGEKWHGIEVVIGLLALMQGLGWAVTLNRELYAAIGKPDINTKLAAIFCLYYTPILFLVAPYGLYNFCYVRLALGVTSFAAYLFFSRRVLGLPCNYLWGLVKAPLFASLAMGGVLFGIQRGLEAYHLPITWFIVSVLVLTGAAIYGSIVWILDRESVNRSCILIREAID